MRKQYEMLPKKLLDICEFFNQMSLKEGVEPVVTRVSDKVDGESGVHPLYRAVDFRNEYVVGQSKKWLYPIETIEYMVDAINKKFPRNDKKLVAIHHSFQHGPFHLHLQIPVAWMTNQEIKRLYLSGII
jgi:hypothetical protein